MSGSVGPIRVDARVLLVFSVLTLVGVARTVHAKPLVALAMAALIWTHLVAPERLGMRLLVTLAMGGLMVLVPRLLARPPAGWPEPALMLRPVTSILFLVAISGSLTMRELLGALQCFRVPMPILELLALAYRFLCLLEEQSEAVRTAYRLRLAWARNYRGIKSAGELTGIVLLRAIMRCERLAVGLRLRCATDQLGCPTLAPLTTADVETGALLLGLDAAIWVGGSR